jgi:predicted AlkP superfamily pyrophosphatase or phosphodiesterase
MGVAAALTLTLSASQPASTGPRLLVILVVDQMRFDYLDRFANQWTAGLKRLRDEGAVFERGFYPYLNTVTCAGHATIGTGAFPSTHGIIMNEWWQRAAGRRMSCTDDPSIVSLAYAGGTPDRIGHSGHRLKVPTLADRLRARSPQSRVVTLSMKPRSTVMLAGHGGTAVTWFGDSNAWATSTAFASGPIPEVARYVSDHPLERLRGEIWTRVKSDADYVGSDESPYERPRPAWRSTFPHPLAPPGTPPIEFYNLWERSPYADAYLGDMAAALIQALQLGRRDAVDYLGVSFSSLDYVGHDFGPDSHEVQDALIRLDRTLGALFASLDTLVGRDRYAIGLSSDHGVAKIPEAQKAAGIDAGRVVNAAVRKVAENALTAVHGPGPHVLHVEYTNLYLTETARRRAESEPAFLQPLIEAVSKMDGVLRVFPSRGLDGRRGSRDPVERAAAFSYYPGESGDVTIVLKPNWIGTDTSTTTHGSMNEYDQHVPVLFMGAPFKPGRYQMATPADIAPTLASLIGLPMPGVDGRVLKEALR